MILTCLLIYIYIYILSLDWLDKPFIFTFASAPIYGGMDSVNNNNSPIPPPILRFTPAFRHQHKVITPITLIALIALITLITLGIYVYIYIYL